MSNNHVYVFYLRCLIKGCCGRDSRRDVARCQNNCGVAIGGTKHSEDNTETRETQLNITNNDSSNHCVLVPKRLFAVCSYYIMSYLPLQRNLARLNVLCCSLAQPSRPVM